ncbi:MAG: protein-glutamate O-methyltransferase [Pseudomonadota bacterium]
MNMRIETPPGDAKNFEFSDHHFSKIANLAHREFGLHLPENKKSLVYSRLARRLRSLKLSGFEEYCGLLENDVDCAESRNLLSALTTNVTHFFREGHHFEILQADVYPKLVGKAKQGEKIRIWSAGCSAGHEPFSIALSLLSSFPDATNFDVKILATDIDPAILSKARMGKYSSDDVDSIPSEIRQRFLSETSDGFEIGSEAKALVSFGELNLIHSWPVKGPFEIIMCRNVAIYFDKQTQAKLWARFAELLSPTGVLMIGHSERLSANVTEQFSSLGVTAYRKKPT